MKVKNSKAMHYMLEALELKHVITGDFIEVQETLNNIAYAINSSDAGIQEIYGNSEEWQELLRPFRPNDDLGVQQ